MKKPENKDYFARYGYYCIRRVRESRSYPPHWVMTVNMDNGWTLKRKGFKVVGLIEQFKKDFPNVTLVIPSNVNIRKKIFNPDDMPF